MGKQMVHSNNIYQIYAYVKNEDKHHTGNVSGMLLYAKTTEDVLPSLSVTIGGNQISARTLDLNRDFKEIACSLDAKLHPKLLRYVISLFKNPRINRHGAQLLFTSHNMSTMKNTVFRRDEIWFAALNEKRSSEIYSLYEIRHEDNERVKSTAAFDKQYLEGRYGADPYLQNMLSGGDWL